MNQQYHNPFASSDLVAPVEQRNFYDWYCLTGGVTSVDKSPFPRMVDFWFAGLSFAAREKIKPDSLSGKDTFKFNDGSVFDRDSWRVQAVMLIAISVEDNVEIVGEPNRMITIANGLAAAGIPEIVAMLRDGSQEPIWNLSDALQELLKQSNM